MSDEQDLGSSSLRKLWEAQWGPGYDDKIMKAIWGLQKEEEWAEEDAKNGEITPENSLQNARDHKNRILVGLENSVGTRRASAIFEKHYRRLEKFLADGKQENAEIAMAAYLADWLGQAAGIVPSHAELDALLTSLRDFGRAVADGSNDPKSELFLPMIFAAKLRAERQHFDDPQKWRRIYFEGLAECANRIEKEQLFRKAEVRTNKLRGKVLSGLRSGIDRSSILYGLIDPKHKPRA